MIDINDIIGKQFNKLTVLKYAEYSNGCHYYICKCECGNISRVERRNLIRGSTKSCGCLRKCKKTAMKTQDIINMRFGKLVVIDYIGNNCYGGRIFRCKCDCGNIKDVPLVSLTSGGTKSCGCLVKESASKRAMSTMNRKDLSGQRFGRLLVLRFADDLEKFEASRFICKCDCGNTCIVRSQNLLNGDTTSCGCFKKEVLKKTRERNNVDGTSIGRLTRKTIATNKSGERGVNWNKYTKRWVASITLQGKHYSKSFINFEDAVEYRRQLEEELWRPMLEKHGRELK